MVPSEQPLSEAIRLSGSGFLVPLPGDGRLPSSELPNGPWRRWFARMIDFWIVALLGGALFGSTELWASISGAIYPLIVCLALIPLESVLLSKFGWTPGKAFMMLRVRRLDGSLLSRKDSLKRSAQVAASGTGLGIPIVTIFTEYHQYKRLISKDFASYEIPGADVYGVERLTRTRLTAAWCVAFLLLYLLGASVTGR